MRVQLSEEDREKYGAPEWIEFTLGQWGLKLVDDLEQEVGWTLEDLENGLFRKDKDDVSNPRPKALAALAWLALRSVKVRIPWDDFDVSALGLKFDWSSGKAPTEQESPTEISDPPSD